MGLESVAEEPKCVVVRLEAVVEEPKCVVVGLECDVAQTKHVIVRLGILRGTDQTRHRWSEILRARVGTGRGSRRMSHREYPTTLGSKGTTLDAVPRLSSGMGPSRCDRGRVVEGEESGCRYGAAADPLVQRVGGSLDSGGSRG